VAGNWPVLARIPRRRFLRIRRNGRIASVVGALVIAVLSALLVERQFPWSHLLSVALIGAWVLAVTWTAKRRWLRWLQRDFAGEVGAKMDAIRRAAPFN
jgi:ABC-type sugar transport system permease subunit